MFNECAVYNDLSDRFVDIQHTEVLINTEEQYDD